MKQLILVFAFICGIALGGQAQGRRGMMNPSERADKQIERLTNQLNLSADQKIKLKPIFENRIATRQKAMELAKTDKEAAKKMMKESLMASEQQLQAILSPEQFQKLKETRKEMREKMKNRRGGKTKEGNDDKDAIEEELGL